MVRLGKGIFHRPANFPANRRPAPAPAPPPGAPVPRRAAPSPRPVPPLMSRPHVRDAAYRQPGRDRLSDRADRAGHGDPHRRRVFRGRRRRAPCRGMRRRLPDRPGAGGGVLPADRRPGRRRARRRGRRGASRLRLPVGERGFRAGLRGGRPGLRRPVAGRDRGDGIEGRGEGADGAGRRAAHARLPWRGPVGGGAGGGGGRARLPRAAEGERRGRRPRDADGRVAGPPRRRDRIGPARGDARLRRRPAAGREVPCARAPCRGAGVRRRARQRGPPVRARLFGAAPPPEGAGGGARARPRPGGPRRAGRRRRRRRPRHRLCRGRDGRVHPRRVRLLLHGDEHPPAGRAPGYRGDYRPRPGGVAVARRGGRAAAALARRRSRCPATPSRRGFTPRTRRGSGPGPAGSRACACPAARRGWTPACARATR